MLVAGERRGGVARPEPVKYISGSIHDDSAIKTSIVPKQSHPYSGTPVVLEITPLSRFARPPDLHQRALLSS